MASKKNTDTPPPFGVDDFADHLSAQLDGGAPKANRSPDEAGPLTEELSAKLQEVHRLNSDLENILTSSQVATVLLDGSLRVKRYTPAAGVLFNLHGSSIGQPLPPL